MEFKDQHVIISGGTRGIGQAISKAFLEAGANVAATYSSNDKAAEEFKASCGRLSERLSLFKFDVSNSSEVEKFYNDYDENFSRIDVLVNSAGIRRDAIVGMLSEKDWDLVLNVNLKGCFLMSKFAVQRMSRQRYGRIINITSPSGKMGFQGQGNYSASKAGMVGLTRSLCQEVAARKITVNCVSPGFIDTELLQDLPDQMVETYRNLIPLKRFGSPAEVSHGVLYLASKQASYVTGTTLEITVGL